MQQESGKVAGSTFVAAAAQGLGGGVVAGRTVHKKLSPTPSSISSAIVPKSVSTRTTCVTTRTGAAISNCLGGMAAEAGAVMMGGGRSVVDLQVHVDVMFQCVEVASLW